MYPNILLDNNFVRNKFPAFSENISKDLIFLENAGGSYVPDTVISRLNRFMIQTKLFLEQITHCFAVQLNQEFIRLLG